MPTSLLDEARTAWRYTRQSIIAEVANLPGDQLGFRPMPASRSVAELVQHIVQSSLMMVGELTRPGGDFMRQGFEDFLREYAGHIPPATSRDELLELLSTTHEEGDRRLAEAGEIFLLQVIRQFNGEYATRFSWLAHGISHEEYHRGQLALYARLLGRVPALTQRLQGEEEVS